MNLTVNLTNNSYEIIIEKGIIAKAGEQISKVFKGRRIVVITDENVFKHYGESLEKSLEKKSFLVETIVLEPGEKTKGFSSLLGIYNKLSDFSITRSDLIIALGGGVIGDLAGFVASNYLRGIEFIQIPTSLLAQVDSSVGGKVAVDLESGKNLVGSFYHPLQVLIDPTVLNTLSDKFFYDGLAEVIKYGAIEDKKLFLELSAFKDKAELLEHIEGIIYRCVDIKRDFVERDEKDKGDRMLLNFGHTLGHAIEKYFDFEVYTHGEAVAIGMYFICKLGENKGLTRAGTSKQIKDILIKYNIPWKVDNLKIGDLLATINRDKKNLNGNLNIILLDEIGKSKIHKTTLSIFEDLDLEEI
ncbi:3-dehydroquinate synthase [Clostridium sp. YIM B02505]|uniref:3-dehydroquinate synthase n=1 Tax=Clostridium yunnanense TaxID=2800325 RepID=A0ABS1EI71_9CLOT|nr:3-dehydroquinate synthase [Clostridium yunnanense]MBK1809077.1 3-dehydroquinate synthase [Clostridium yunnanense]